MPVPPAHSQGLGQSPFVNRTMLYISLLLWSDYINNAGKASVQHNETIFLILVDSYGNSLAKNPLHHQWPQVTAGFKNLSPSWKLRRLITWTERDRKMCQKLLSETLNSVLLPFISTWILKLSVQSCSCLTSVQSIMSWASNHGQLCWEGNGGAAQHQSPQKQGWEL